MPNKKTIYVTAGAKRYVGGTITETTGKNISGDTIVLALGPKFPAPPKSGATAPDSDASPTPPQRLVKKMIDSTVTPQDDIYLWAWVSDNPEVEPILLDGPFDVV